MSSRIDSLATARTPAPHRSPAPVLPGAHFARPCRGRSAPGWRRARRCGWPLALLTVGLLGACGRQPGAPAELAARVNGDEITAQQIDAALNPQRGGPSVTDPALQRRMLDRLIDEQIAAQKAQALKLDQEPAVQQRILEARREILARAYLESVAASAGQPDGAAVRAWFDAHPGLFAQRKIYTLQRLQVQLPPERRADALARVEAARTGPELTDWLNRQGFRFSSAPETQPAEALPMALVDKLSTLPPGRSVAMPQQFGLTVLTIEAAQAAPKTFDEARTPIERFLAADLRHTALQATAQALREGARVEYLGRFAPPAASAVPAAASGAGR